MSVWPSGLPPISPDGYNESPPNNVIRSEMDGGPPKIRPRSTAGVRPISMTMHMTDVQVEVLDSFFVTTLMSGSIPFEWTHPRTGSPIIAQFSGPPKYTPDGPLEFNVSFSIEVLP